MIAWCSCVFCCQRTYNEAKFGKMNVPEKWPLKKVNLNNVETTCITSFVINYFIEL